MKKRIIYMIIAMTIMFGTIPKVSVSANTFTGTVNGVRVSAIPFPRGGGRTTIFGDDNRQQITEVDDFPYQAIVHIQVTFPNGTSSGGSGAFVSDTTIITNAHVIYDGESGGHAKSIAITPGGTWSSYPTIATNTRTVVPPEWIETGDRGFDFGIIILPERVNVGGWFDIQPLNDNELQTSRIIRYGFDGDKENGTLWQDEPVIGSLHLGSTPILQRSFTYLGAVASGASGGPIVLYGTTTIVGIHSFHSDVTETLQLPIVGDLSYFFPVHLGAVRITNDVVEFVNRNQHTYEITGVCDCGICEDCDLCYHGHTAEATATCTTPQVCTVCSDEIAPPNPCGDCIDCDFACNCLTCDNCGFFGGKFGFGRVTNTGGSPAITDALAILRYLVGLSSPIATCNNARAAANITNHGLGSPVITDALAILRFLVELESPVLDSAWR
jgi:V8-like Glu-specific endopeptidase